MESMAYTDQPHNSSLSLCPSAVTLLFIPSIYTLLFLTALPGNALSLWVFLRCISSVTPIHIYLSHLSISNLLLSLTSPFLTAYFARGSVWDLSSVLCQIVVHGITPVLHINVYISLLILAWVALSRFALLIQNTHASRPSTCATLLPNSFFTCLKRVSFANTVCATVWLISVGSIVPVTVYYSVNEAMKSRKDGEKESGGGGEMCYSPTVELGGSTSAILSTLPMVLFFVLYFLVLVSYVTLLRHIRRSHRNAHIPTSQSLLTRVFRNIVVIQVVLSVCLLPYHIFKPIFMTLAHQPHLLLSPGVGSCHPLSVLIEVKNCLILLAALRGSTDPIMYFLLDRAFRHQTLRLFWPNQTNSSRQEAFWSTTDKIETVNTVTASVDTGHGGVL
ncbi:probable G-protein coupled receptor 82 isoform X2 [Leuresthes tenuis]